MIVSIDGVELFTITDAQKKVIANDISADILDEDLQRRLKWVIENKYNGSLRRLKEEWDVKLKDRGIQSFPVKDDMYAELVFAQPDYKPKIVRDLEDQAVRDAATGVTPEVGGEVIL